MGQTFTRQDQQVRESVTFDDTRAPTEANFETNATDLEYDLNSLRSMVSHLLDVQAGDWFDVVNTPSAFEGGAQRGVNDLNTDLHDFERKRVLKRFSEVGKDITVGGSDNFVILGTGELPDDTTAAVGAVTTLGTVVAFHAGTFGTHSLDEVAGANALQPKNLCLIIDASTLEPIVDGSDVEIKALLQTETASDGHTITDATTTRAQLSFVKANGTGDDLIAAADADIQGLIINFANVQRHALEDLPEECFLGDFFGDSGSANVTRQASYDNQAAAAVDLTTNATLDLEGAGLVWSVRDDLEADLFVITEGSAGGTSDIQIAAGVDTFDVDAIVNDFASGVTTASGSTPIAIGVTAGVVETTGVADLIVRSGDELVFDDVYRSSSTWSLNGIRLADTAAEWTAFEAAFGEVSLLNAIEQANGGETFTKATGILQSNVAANVDVSGPGGSSNLDVNLLDYSSVVFVDKVVITLNGVVLRNGANAAANHDVYPGTTDTIGELKFEFALHGTGSKPDQIQMWTFA